MEDIKKALEKFGLTENEVTIYLETLNHSEISPYELSKLTKIPRTTVYDIILNLALKGLAEMKSAQGLEKQQTKIRANNPSVLRTILQQRKDELIKSELEIADVLPELKTKFYKGKTIGSFNFYPGAEGLKKALVIDEFYNVDLTIYCIFTFSDNEVFSNKYPFDFVQTRGIKTKSAEKILFPLNNCSKTVITNIFSNFPDLLRGRELRFIEASEFGITNEIIVQGNRVSVVSASDDELWGLAVKSDAYARTMLAMFKTLWLQSTILTEEIILSWSRECLA